MAYWIDSDKEYVGTPAQMDFWCDTPDDVQNLPTSSTMGVQQGEDTVSCQMVNKGSTCISIEPIKMFVLNSEDRWVEAKKGD